MSDIMDGAGIGLVLGPLVKVAVDVVRHWFHVDGRYVHVLTAGVSLVVAAAVVHGLPGVSFRDVIQVAAIIVGSTLSATGVNEITPGANILEAKEKDNG